MALCGSRCSARRLVALSVAALIILFAGAARAALYRVPILAESEDELRDLLEEGELDEEEFERLVHLVERPLDLNRARREALYDLPGLTWPMVDQIVKYREEQPFRDVDDLTEAGVPEDVVRQLYPFVKVAKRLARAPIITGDARLHGIERFSDDRTPSFNIRSRVTLFGRVDAGISMLLQDKTGPFSWNHEDGLTWISADEPGFTFSVPKFYVTMDEGLWSAIIGSYQVGFGERLVFDESTRLEPNGFYPDDLLSEYEESGKFGNRERMYGVAASLNQLPLGEGAGALDATIWFSWWPYDLSQVDAESFLRYTDDSAFYGSSVGMSNPLFCESGVDPEACAAQKTGRLNYQTLRSAFTELVVGGHVAYLPTPQWRIGTTAYWSMIDWLEGGGDLFFAPAARYPNRDQFGAFGLDVQGTVSIVSLFAEYARTFDGGNAVSGRVILGWKRFDVELSGRWYDDEFDTPHARGSAADDEYRGQRDRDEAGGGVRVTFRPLKWFNGGVDLDVWTRPTLGYSALDLTSRFDFVPLDWLVVSTGVDYRDKVLSQGGRDEDYDDKGTSTIEVDPYNRRILDILDERTVGRGAKVAAWLQLAFTPLGNLKIVAFVKSTLKDDEVSERAYYYPQPLRLDLSNYYADHFAHDFYTWLRVDYEPIDGLELSARVKYLDVDTEYEVRGDRYVEGWLQARWRIADPVSLQLRYRIRGYVDEDVRRGQDTDGDGEPDLVPETYDIEGGTAGIFETYVPSDIEHVLKGVVDVKF